MGYTCWIQMICLLILLLGISVVGWMRIPPCFGIDAWGIFLDLELRD